VVPLIPFLLRGATQLAQIWSIAVTLVALFGIGMALSLFNGRSAVRGGLRMLLIGAAASGCTWLLGHALGMTLG
jgi:VIT1/CCC1 family predicted Fe2+/Mn2+ transporter